MQVSHSLADWRERRRAFAGRSMGFVPTMGALHRGHASLVERCRRENEIVVVSIFVNPTQFDDPKDLERYPRTLDQDMRLLESVGADEVMIPTVSELYPNGYHFRVEPDSRDQVLEGAYRPGFLQGVLTIVLKLLNCVRASRAYFGEKDYQQWHMVRQMAQEFFFSTEIILCPTVREESGLAMSSRNRLLSPEGRERAAYLFRVLSTEPNRADALSSLEARGFVVDYVEERWGRRLAAALLEGVRLIDNVPIMENMSYTTSEHG
jgi:pantoate--beta-alanine ligase